MHGQSSKTRDQSRFSKTLPFTELLWKTGAEHFHGVSTVSNHALKCGDVFYKM